MDETLRKGIEKGREIVTQGRIDSHKLQPGDHIFVMRYLHTYAHHGIYVGDECVIHFQDTHKRNSNPKPPCPKCGYRKSKDLGVVKTCLGCFITKDNPLNGHSLHLYQYGLSSVEYAIRRRGTCSTNDASKPPQEVVKTATDLLKTGFDDYDIVLNNSEDFARFCKTGIRSSLKAELVDLVPVGEPIVAAVGAAALTFASYFGGRQNRTKSIGETWKN